MRQNANKEDHPVPVAPPAQPTLTIKELPSYIEHYANHVQIRVTVWDFYLGFGRMHQNANEIAVEVAAGILLSPQQAKAVFNLLAQNLQSYEKAFGEIVLEPVPTSSQPN